MVIEKYLDGESQIAISKQLKLTRIIKRHKSTGSVEIQRKENLDKKSNFPSAAFH